MMLDELKAKRKELKRKYQYAGDRHADLRTRVVIPEHEALRKKLMNRWAVEKLRLNQMINDLGVQIYNLEKEAKKDAE